MAGVLDVPRLAAGTGLQPPLAVPVEAASGSLVAGGRDGDVLDPGIHADELPGLVLLRLGRLARGGQIEDAVPLDQAGLALAVLLERRQRLGRATKAHILDRAQRRTERGREVPAEADERAVRVERGLGEQFTAEEWQTLEFLDAARPK
ncbi:hypothetical protein [Streptomyces boncukensis]|uniref:Uncharacterized protein n=1 Tax=Streptomyces boncukensis TaxID=2711219 RepID=A0A6G4WSE9_9ACTN|nr:hypothetical protein [Streptomyces boncukensis]NGO67772.1 hypothetical protein [Streptomyces boncukensis]